MSSHCYSPFSDPAATCSFWAHPRRFSDPVSPQGLSSGDPRAHRPPDSRSGRDALRRRGSFWAPAAPYLPPAEKEGAGGRRRAARSPQPAPRRREAASPAGPPRCPPAAMAARRHRHFRLGPTAAGARGRIRGGRLGRRPSWLGRAPLCGRNGLAQNGGGGLRRRSAPRGGQIQSVYAS